MLLFYGDWGAAYHRTPPLVPRLWTRGTAPLPVFGLCSAAYPLLRRLMLRRSKGFIPGGSVSMLGGSAESRCW